MKNTSKAQLLLLLTRAPQPLDTLQQAMRATHPRTTLPRLARLVAALCELGLAQCHEDPPAASITAKGAARRLGLLAKQARAKASATPNEPNKPNNEPNKPNNDPNNEPAPPAPPATPDPAQIQAMLRQEATEQAQTMAQRWGFAHVEGRWDGFPPLPPLPQEPEGLPEFLPNGQRRRPWQLADGSVNYDYTRAQTARERAAQARLGIEWRPFEERTKDDPKAHAALLEQIRKDNLPLWRSLYRLDNRRDQPLRLQAEQREQVTRTHARKQGLVHG